MPQHVRKGDLVMVIAGKDAHREGDRRIGKVLRVLPRENKVIVEGMNVRKKAIRPNQNNPQGGFSEKEMPIHLSNVMPVVDGKPTRVRFESRPDGSKVRIAVSTGQPFGPELRKARERK